MANKFGEIRKSFIEPCDYYEHHREWLYEKYSKTDWSWSIKERKAYVRTRDNFTCQECGSKNNVIIHHLEGAGNYTGGRGIYFDPDKLVCLCRSCHQKVHNNPYHRYYPIDRRKDALIKINSELKRVSKKVKTL